MKKYTNTKELLENIRILIIDEFLKKCLNKPLETLKINYLELFCLLLSYLSLSLPNRNIGCVIF